MKYILIISLFLVSMTAEAQYLYRSFSQDTITNTEADTLTWSRTFAKKVTFACHCEYTELSGTSDVDQIMEGSYDGSQWFTIDTDTLVNGVNAAELHQVTLSSASNANRFRMRLVGAGTQSLQYKCAVAIKED